ncbi:multidrug resistance-associated ABC transporter [Mycena metata]|uniref:Multidrug resistance-associated ABC transporter n=1 Tax=Mycena metata TaxID=1033252 RepID=A0AAD7KHA8_9AGAR|nr:multidrug resistance-associated ABC transporter [Mycena metata]
MDYQVLPVCVAAASLTFVAGRCLATKFRSSVRSEPKAYPIDGEASILVFGVLKLLACATLVSVQIAIATRASGWGKLVLGLAYAYTAVLAWVSLIFPRSTLSVHLNIILFLSLSCYVYRDILPFATFTLVPEDLDEGRLLWAKILLLFIAGVVLPLASPRRYIPVNPEKPMAQPNAEQTCSTFESFTFGYLNPLIFLAYKQGGLSAEQLPALADSNSAEYLIQKSFPALDPFRAGASKHLLSGFLRVYRQDYIAMLGLALAKVLSEFAGPVVMNRLLASLENKDMVVRPWVWVASLFLVPLSRAVIHARYTWIATRQRTQAEGIIVQLLFKHSLRIRMNTETKDSNKRNLVGRLNNMTTSDVATVVEVMEVWITMLLAPVQISLAIWFLYAILGWSSFVGLAVILATLPLPSFVVRKMRALQKISRQKTDARVQKVTETMNVLRMIKWFAWESKIKEDVGSKRQEELDAIRNVRLLVVLNNSFNFIIPLLTMLATFSTYTLVMKKELTASIVFTSLAVFDGILRQQIRGVMNNIPDIVQGYTSLDRIDTFLRTTELLDSYSNEDSSIERAGNSDKIGFQDAEFTWSSDFNDTSFKLRVGSEVTFRSGAINLIIGPTGVGKTAALLALLGEMHFIPAGPNAYFNLPRQGGVAYAAQQPWVENATIKQNIVFDAASFDEARYKKVLYACALGPDLELLEAGDETEVGERGLTLSGGQKARVSLARAIYSNASTILLDDVLAALDTHTGKWIVDNCLSSDLVQGRTVILVSHNVALTRPISQWVVSLNSDGSIVQGPVEAVLKHTDLALVVEEPEEEKTAEVAQSAKPTGKLMVKEESQQGTVKWPTYWLFFANLNSRPILFMTLICSLFLLNEANTAFQFYFLGYWSSQYLDRPASSVSAPFYLAVYSASIILTIAFYITAYALYAFGTMRAAKIIHGKFIDSVIGATLRWLDTTPMSRVITRATQDINRVDNNFSLMAVALTEMTIFMFVKLITISILTPAFILPGATIAVVSVFAGHVYMVAQRNVQRTMSAARSPMLAHFAAAIAGLTSIRAYGAEETFLKESEKRIDDFLRPAISFWNFNRWIAMRTDVLGGVFSAGLGWYLIYGGGSHYGPANIGFTLSAAISFTSVILRWVRNTNALQLNANNLERVADYLEIEQEPKPTRAGEPPAYWPASGDVRVEHLSAKYSSDGPTILHDISFSLKSGERVAIVGRTGSGKSSLTLSILRSILTEGTVYYDGLPTSSINLDALRSNITIIPQVPEILGGTLRRNLDPFEAHEDSVLNDALRAAGLFSLQADGEKQTVTLNTVISSEGGNLSLGQRQIVALARAIVRRSKLLILDEATSAIDYRTDAIIQSTLRNELSGVTLITVAHRLQTIMDYDRVMVLETGRIVEFDTPANLLHKKSGQFFAMVNESSDRDALLASANL